MRTLRTLAVAALVLSALAAVVLTVETAVALRHVQRQQAFEGARGCELVVVRVATFSSTGDPLTVVVDGSDCGFPGEYRFSYVGVPARYRNSSGAVPVQVSREGVVRHAYVSGRLENADDRLRILATALGIAVLVAGAAGAALAVVHRR